jgi:hypothetical protein
MARYDSAVAAVARLLRIALLTKRWSERSVKVFSSITCAACVAAATLRISNK